MKAFFLKIPRSSFSSFTDIPVIYERNAGYKGRAQGEIKDKNPAPKARKILTCSVKRYHQPLYISYTIHHNKNKHPVCKKLCTIIERFLFIEVKLDKNKVLPL